MLEFLIFIVIIVLIIALIIFLIKKIFKIGLILLVIFIILVIVTGGSIFNDFNNLKNKITSSSVMVLLENNGNIVSGFTEGTDVLPIDVSGADGLYRQNRLDLIKDKNYKLFVIKTSALSDININGKNISSNRLNNFFVNNIPISSINQQDIVKENKLKGLEFKTALFAYVYENELSITIHPVSFFKSYKAGTIIVYPDTLFFKFVKIVPFGWISEKLNILETKIKQGVNDTAKNIKEAI